MLIKVLTYVSEKCEDIALVGDFFFFNSKSTTSKTTAPTQQSWKVKPNTQHTVVGISSQKVVQIHISQLKNSSSTYWLPTVCESHSHSSWTLFVCVSCDLLAFFFMFVWINLQENERPHLLSFYKHCHHNMLTTCSLHNAAGYWTADHIWLPWKEFRLMINSQAFPLLLVFS